ncbi:hypothetical protein ZWY2020_010561 [Hordeum vulgare]|nr:hypothetical protein ZWY2020_010561 [Hordeum vulgare]
MRPIACINPNRLVLVSDLIDSTSARWRQELVNTTFLPIDAEVILNISLRTRQYDYYWAWSREKKGDFTVRSFGATTHHLHFLLSISLLLAIVGITNTEH